MNGHIGTTDEFAIMKTDFTGERELNEVEIETEMKMKISLISGVEDERVDFPSTVIFHKIMLMHIFLHRQESSFLINVGETCFKIMQGKFFLKDQFLDPEIIR